MYKDEVCKSGGVKNEWLCTGEGRCYKCNAFGDMKGREAMVRRNKKKFLKLKKT